MTLARTGPKPVAVILRAGIHRLAKTLKLTPNDSGLVIQAYPGENVEVTGAAKLNPTWEHWKDLSKHGGTSMTLLPNTNVVYGAQFNTSSDGFTFYGTTPTAAACSSLCEKDNNCIAFTWHDWLQPSGDRQWDGQCYGVDSDTPR